MDTGNTLLTPELLKDIEVCIKNIKSSKTWRNAEANGRLWYQAGYWTAAEVQGVIVKHVGGYLGAFKPQDFSEIVEKHHGVELALDFEQTWPKVKYPAGASPVFAAAVKLAESDWRMPLPEGFELRYSPQKCVKAQELLTGIRYIEIMTGDAFMSARVSGELLGFSAPASGNHLLNILIVEGCVEVTKPATRCRGAHVRCTNPLNPE